MPILWAPRISASSLQENLHVHEIPRFRGGELGFFGGGSADFIFMGAGIFLNFHFDIIVGFEKITYMSMSFLCITLFAPPPS